MTGTWWRRNRLALALLVPVILITIAASSSRVQLFWWPSEPRQLTEGTVGQAVHFTQPWRDMDGDHTREVTVTLTSARATSTLTNYAGKDVTPTLPQGATLWDLELHFEADPGQVLAACEMVIFDTEGRRYTPGNGPLQDELVSRWACTPQDAPGPSAHTRLTGPGKADEPVRPPRYTTHAYVVTRSDTRPERIRINWDWPQALVLRIPAG